MSCFNAHDLHEFPSLAAWREHHRENDTRVYWDWIKAALRRSCGDPKCPAHSDKAQRLIWDRKPRIPQCPKCGLFRDDDDDDCTKCGPVPGTIGEALRWLTEVDSQETKTPLW